MIKQINPTVLFDHVNQVIKNDKKSTAIDAVIDYCTNNGIDTDYAAKLIRSHPSLKSMIKLEGQSLNLIK